MSELKECNEETEITPAPPQPARREITPEEQEVQAASKQITISMSPPKRCPSCKLKTYNLKEHGYPDGLLMFPIPNMGICHFTCPRCFAIFMNKECFSTQRKLRKQQSRRSPDSIIQSPNVPMRRPDNIINLTK